MALLQKGFDTPDNKTAIENLTVKLKKGIVAASNHFFEQKFPHGIREAIFSTIEPVKERPTPQQSERAIKRYLREIGQTTSKRENRIDLCYWGSEVTLKMISKILNKKIYVVVASTGLETSSFQVFYPAQSNRNGETYMTVKEKNFSIGAPEDWIQDIQAGFKTEDTPTQDPIVLLFQSEHYTWLRFAKREDGASLDESQN
ncbi:hypothetical protein GN244_ATG15999 [Phytophthora infestans]|uniref:Uncharacterized protein n=1 Tax=Phytophthora infestans TaxID=4787 RepID=A0A833SBQ4_PHYIN|nr:hypothetical protein GN244_ATG15999 [Phytophthora infestans]